MSYEGNNWRTAIAEPRQTTRAADLAKQPNVLPIYAANWKIASADVVQNVAPARPVVQLCMGPEDQTGGVLIESDEVGPQRFVRVTPESPWTGRLTLPFRVWPMIRETLPGLTASVKMNLLAFYELQPILPLRGTLIEYGTLTAASSSIVVPTLGRKMVRVTTDVPSAAADVRIDGGAIGPSGIVYANFAGGAAVALEMFYTWDATQAYPAAANNQRGMRAPDFVRVRLVGAVAQTVAYSIVAEDR